MDRFSEMRTFVEVARAGVTGAAKSMRIAPSAVSRRVKDLEARLGADLLTRTTRRMELTDIGRSYLADCQRLLEEVEGAEAKVGDVQITPSGSIRLAAPLSFGLTDLQPMLNKFMQTYPDVQIDLDLDDRRVDLARERYDLAIRADNLEDSSLISRKIGKFGLLPTAGPDFISRHKTFSDPNDLSGLPGLCYSGTEQSEVWHYSDPHGRSGKVRVAPRFFSNNGDVLRDAAIDGLGLTLLPHFIVRTALEKGLLMPVLPDYSWRQIDLFALWPAQGYLPRRVRLLIDHLAAGLGQRTF